MTEPAPEDDTILILKGSSSKIVHVPGPDGDLPECQLRNRFDPEDYRRKAFSDLLDYRLCKSCSLDLNDGKDLTLKPCPFCDQSKLTPNHLRKCTEAPREVDYSKSGRKVV